MKLKLTPYANYEIALPQQGQHILGQMRGNNIVVYQAFNPEIANYAVKHQVFGGPNYSFGRMSWIKPNFLWMMYRAGWATKPNQERILAIEIGLDKFERILAEAVYSSYQADVYGTHEHWKLALEQSEVRLQWDPDHNPYGEKLQRRAIQLGMRGEILQSFGTEWIENITDITTFIKTQGELVKNKQLDQLEVPQEQVIAIQNPATRTRLKLD